MASTEADDPFLAAAHDATRDPLSALLPPKLGHEAFGQEQFDANAFLLSRRHIAIEDLRSELKAYLESLRQELVGVINEEYEDFLGLGTGLRGTDRRLERMRGSISGFTDEIQGIANTLIEAQTAIQDKLQEREAIRVQKGTLRLLLSVHESVLKVEALLLIPSPESKLPNGVAKPPAPTAPNSHRFIGTSSQRIERVAAEYNQLLYLVRKAGKATFVARLQPVRPTPSWSEPRFERLLQRIEEISKTLQRDLASLLASVLHSLTDSKPRSVPEAKATRESLFEVLRTYQFLSKTQEAEQVIRLELVRPFVQRTIRRDAIAEARSPLMPTTPALANHDLSLTSQNDLGTSYHMDLIQATDLDGAPDLGFQDDAIRDLFNKILTFIVRDCGVVLEVTEKRLALLPATEAPDELRPDQPRRQQFHVLANVVWEELATRLASELGHVLFASGQPDVFHKHYTLTSLFVSKIDALSGSVAQLQALRSHPSYEAFQRKWQLPVYFQLRFKETVASVEQVLGSPEAAALRPSEQFLLPATGAIHRAIWQVWQRNVVIPDLVPRFWRLTLQLIARYSTWLEGALAPLLAVSSTAGTASDKDKGASRAGTPQPQSQTGSEEQALRLLTVHVADIQRFEAAVSDLFEKTIADQLPVLEEAEPDDTPKAIVQSSLSALISRVPKLSAAIISLLIKACAEPLRSVKPVASQIRASNKRTTGQPEPSYFINSVLKPCRDYQNGPGQLISGERKAVWFAQVTDEVAARYAAILSEMKKTDSYLQKLKKNRQGFSSFFGGSKPADESPNKEEDRVKLQMQADVQALAKDAADNLRIPLDSCPNLQSLLAEAAR